MKLIIEIESNIVKAILEEKNRIIGQESFELDNNLTEKLLPTIDKLLKKHKLEPRNLKKAELKCDAPNSYTTHRIAKVVADTINFSLHHCS